MSIARLARTETAPLAPQNCRVWSQDGVPIVALPEEVEPFNAHLWRPALLEVSAGNPVVIVDLTVTHLFMATGYNALIAARNQQWGTGGEIWLAAPQAQVRCLLEALNLDHLFRVFASVPEALAWHRAELRLPGYAA